MTQELILRNYQERAIGQLFDAWKQGARSVIMTVPTGAGKRLMALWLMKYAQERERKTLFVANRRLLVDQAWADAEKYGVSYGVIMANREQGDIGSTNQIASIHTLESWYFYDKDTGELDGTKLPSARLVQIDEAHQETKRYKKLLELYPDSKFVCFSATPVGSQGRSIVPDPFDHLIEPVKNSELIRDGFLLNTTVFAPSEPNIQGVGIDGGKEYNQSALGRAVREVTLFADIFKEWEAYQDQATVVFVPGIAYGRDIVNQFNHRLGSSFHSGKAAYLIEAKTPQKEREEIIARVADDGKGVLVSCDILREGFDCLDTETEILTSRGWLGRQEVGCQDDVWTLNRATGAAEIVPIQRITVRETAPGERMFSIKSQHIDIRTTEGHEFHVKYNNTGKISENWLTKTGAQLYNRKSDYILPISAEFDYPGISLSDDEIKFVAWFMTDGCLTRGTVQIAQAAHKFHDDIRGVLKSLSMKFGEYRGVSASGYPTKNPFYYRFVVPRGVKGAAKGRGWLKYAEWLNKSVCPKLHQMTRRQFKIFWDEMMKGDGSVHSTNQLICNLECQADAYTQMAITRGYAAIKRKDLTKNGTPVWYVGIRDKKFICSRPTDPRSAKMQLEIPESPETVWCVTNRNGTLITRRHGKVAILGNCPSLSVAIDLQPNSQLRTYWQKVGRIKRPYPGQSVATYLDFAGNYWRFPHPNEDPEWPIGGSLTTQDIIDRRRADKTDPQPIACPRCGLVRHSGSVCPGCGHASGDPVRRVRMGDGRLVEIPLENKKKRELTDAQRAYNEWKGCLYGALARGWTYGQCIFIYRKKTGEWPKDNWPGVCGRQSLELKRRPADDYTKAELTRMLIDRSPK